MTINKTFLFGIIIGIFVAGFAFQVYVNYQFRNLYIQDHTTLAQVVQFINANTKQPEVAK